MVVFGTVSANISPELCKVIPGDTAAKVAYLQEELQEHYPQVMIKELSCSVNIKGKWQEILDLHSVLDQWYMNFLNAERQRLELSNQHEQDTHTPAPNTAPDSGQCNSIVSTTNRDILQKCSSDSIQQYDSEIANNGSAILLTTSSNVSNPSQTLVENQNKLGHPSSINQELSQAELSKYVSKESHQFAHVADEKNGEAPNHMEQLVEENKLQENHQMNMSTSSILNTSDVLTDVEFSDIKSFIKSWTGRTKDQEVQTEEVPQSSPGRRRGRKPGSPRKAKAHIPVKREGMFERSRSKPDRFVPEVIAADHSTPKRRRGRPKKKYSNILPEEMIPVPALMGENVIGADDSFNQPLPSFDDIELVAEQQQRQTEHVSLLPDPMVMPNATGSLESCVPTLPPDEFEQTSQRSAKTKALIKVGEMAQDDNIIEVITEKRGRKPTEGPCVSRDVIEAYLPPENTLETGPFKCNLCQYVGKRRATLKQHYLRCHLDKKFQCRTCGKKYSLLKELATHKLTHNRRHQCQFCEKKFATQHLLDGHVERRHLNPKKKPSIDDDDNAANRQCAHCDFVSKSRKSLQDHMDRIHGEKIHPCPICNKMFALVKDLNQHVKFHSEVYQCDECGKSLKSKLALKLHINGIHRGIKLVSKKEYVCEDCGKICRNKTHFKEHINKEHLHVKPYQCNICSQAFFTKHALKCHGRVHSDIREFVCDLCNKGFKNRSGLRVHRITHQEVSARPYICATCNKAFTQRGALVRHERIHSGDRPYKCRLCDSSFNDYSILRRHVVGVHKINDRALCGRVDIDPNVTNRGRPKVPGPVQHPDSEILNSQKQAEIMANAEKQAELLAQAAVLKVAQDMQPTPLETIDGTAAGISNIAQTASFPSYVETNHQANTSITQHIIHQPAHKAEVSVTSTQEATPSHTPGPKDLSLAHSSTTSHPQHQMQHVELITIGSDLGTTVPSHHQTLPIQHPVANSSMNPYNVSNMVPISVVSDMVQNVLYEHHHALEGGYTIGMPVFPTPTTVANMHMMQALPGGPGQHTITHLPPPSNNLPDRDRQHHM